MALLDVQEVSLSFGGLQALDGISLDVDVGHVTGLIGPTVPARRHCSTS